MKALNQNGKIVNVETTNDERMFFFHGEQIEDLNSFNPGTDALNDLEKAKDALYDLPLFDGEFIVSKCADWEVKQAASKCRSKFYLTAEKYYASEQDAYIDSENTADCDVHISFGECGDLYGQTNIDAFFFANSMTREKTFFTDADIETVLEDILSEALVDYVAGGSSSGLISYIAENYGNCVRGELAWLESHWIDGSESEMYPDEKTDELIDSAASAIAKIVIGEN